MFSPALRYLQRESGVRRHLLGPLTEPRLWALFVATFGLATAVRACSRSAIRRTRLRSGCPAARRRSSSRSTPWAARPGGALYGGLHFKAPVERQFACALGLMVLPLFLHAIVGPVALFAIVAFFAGALIAP